MTSNVHPGALPNTAELAAIEGREIDDRVHLPDDFWRARPELAQIRTGAHSGMMGADATFGAVLARVAAMMPPSILLPRPVGHSGSLNVAIALVGPPGTGKTAGMRTAAELVPFPEDIEVTEHPLGSGEGISESYMGEVDEMDDNGKVRRVRRQVRRHLLAKLDEGRKFIDMGSRSGSTLFGEFCSAWAGADLGQANADPNRTRRVLADQYRFAFITGFQPEHAVRLLEDTSGGTPDRFLFLLAVDPTIPRHPPAWPGAIDLRPPRHGAEPMTLDDEATWEIRERHHRKQTGQALPGEDSTGHRDLSRLKVAALLALLDGGRLHVDRDDWELAGIVQDISDAVRDGLEESSRIQKRQAEEARTRTQVTRTLTTEESLDRRAHEAMIRAISRHVHRGKCEGGCRRRCMSRATKGADRQRANLDEAIDEAIGRDHIKAGADGTFEPGTVKPL